MLTDELAKLWQDLAKRPLWRRPYTGKYIKLALKTRLTFIDPRRVKVMVPSGKVNYCQECTANCCVGKSSTVMLRLQDIAKLIDCKQDGLITFDMPTFTQEEQDERPALWRNLQGMGLKTFPIIKQTPYHACMALSEDGQCKLYPHWPTSCARFPYSLHADDRVIFYSPRCSSYRVDKASIASARHMQEAAVDAYNARIRDIIMLEYVPEELRRLGLMGFIRQG
jgi:Fe-S-cluster containining protein